MNIGRRLLADLVAEYDRNPEYDAILDFPFHEYPALERKRFWELAIAARQDKKNQPETADNQPTQLELNFEGN